jgi:hypothetical protein
MLVVKGVLLILSKLVSVCEVELYEIVVLEHYL